MQKARINIQIEIPVEAADEVLQTRVANILMAHIKDLSTKGVGNNESSKMEDGSTISWECLRPLDNPMGEDEEKPDREDVNGSK